MVVVVVLIVGAAVSFFALVPPTNDGTGTTSTSSTSSETTLCQGTTPVTGQTIAPTTFGAVTEYALPNDTSPNAISVQPDGSVWFAVNGLPGVAHLDPDGTLNEYKLPFSTTTSGGICGEQSYSWGVAFWNGSAWVANEDQAQIEGVNPTTGAITNITLPSGTSPYTLAVGPDGDLWFTQLAGGPGPELGRITPGTYAVQYYQFPGNYTWLTAYVAFANSTLAYVLTINPFILSSVTSIVYSFNPELASPTFTQVGTNTTLYDPSSVAIGEGGLWLTAHAGSGMEFFNETSSTWTFYPTSLVPYVPTTLTYFDASNGSTVWFNEHYGDKISEIFDNATKLTEYAVSDPPTDNLSLIPNTLTMATGDGRTWFTQWTGDVIGFVNQSYAPPFSISTQNSTIHVEAGSSAQVQLQLTGQDSRNLSVEFSDNEFNNGTTQDLTFTPSVSSLQSLTGPQTISISISAASSIEPGDYIAAMTVSDGLVLQSVYVTIVVTAA